ncbi:MAG: FecR family protein [Treponema sp.]|jgi:hypothetical protein|nr:FecR family protein [Treponema sp.]
MNSMSMKNALFVLIFVMAGGFLYAQGTDTPASAFFRDLSGTVETRYSGSAVWVNAAKGDSIGKDTIISTGFRSTAVISLGNSTLTVRPLTRLSLEEIIRNQNGEQVNLYLQTGRVRAKVNPPSGGTVDFTIRSPSVTASVRGTSFDFDTENIRVEEGQVLYSLANERQVYVDEGERSYVDEVNNRVTSPFDAAREDAAPGLPPGNGSGNPAGDNAPVIIPPVLSSPQDGSASVGFGWD